MAVVVLARVDDRLIHGTVAVRWVPYLAADILVVADHEATDSAVRQLLEYAVPKGAQLLVEEPIMLAERLLYMPADVRILVLWKTLSACADSIDSGFEPPNGSVQLAMPPQTALWQTEQKALHRLQQKGIRVYIQYLPQHPKEAL